MCDMDRLMQLRLQAQALVKELEAYIATERAKEATAALPYPDARSVGTRIR